MQHTEQCCDNMQEMRVESTTQPWLGENMYAEERAAPRIPWRPNAVDIPAEPVMKPNSKKEAEEEK